MSTPLEFNDRFDSQIHVTDDFYNSLCNEINITPDENNLYRLKLELNLMLSKLRIACFSKIDPISSNSTNMWGLYGNTGTGIAISYNYADLLKCFYEYYSQNNNDKSFDDIKYEEGYNPSKVITNLVKHAFNHNNSKIGIGDSDNYIRNYLKTFIYTKSKAWEHEEEIRFVYFADSKLAEEAKESINNLPQDDISLQKALDFMNDKNRYEKFLKPIRITLGWNCDELDPNIIKLRNYCRDREIAVIKLNGKVNYEKYLLEYETLLGISSDNQLNQYNLF